MAEDVVEAGRQIVPPLDLNVDRQSLYRIERIQQQPKPVSLQIEHGPKKERNNIDSILYFDSAPQ